MVAVTTALGTWLQAQIDHHNLNQMTAAAQIGVGVGTISDILRRGQENGHRKRGPQGSRLCVGISTAMCSAQAISSWRSHRPVQARAVTPPAIAMGRLRKA